MEIVKMIAELRSERAAIEEALLVLERLARGQGKRRGRPPAWLAMGKTAAAPTARKKRVLTEAVRKRIAAAQKKRWAAYRKAKAASHK
jgi:hypothetical protein